MKKLIIAALLVVSVSAFAQDQNQGSQQSSKPKKEKMTLEQKNQAVLDRMTSELSLSPTQQDQIKPIIADQTAKMEAMKAERKANGGKEMTDDEKEAFKEKRKEDRKAMEAKLKTILTPDQFKTMKANEAANKEKMKEMRGNGGNGGNGNGNGNGSEE